MHNVGMLFGIAMVGVIPGSCYMDSATNETSAFADGRPLRV